MNEKIIESLSPNERKILPLIKENPERYKKLLKYILLELLFQSQTYFNGHINFLHNKIIYRRDFYYEES